MRGLMLGVAAVAGLSGTAQAATIVNGSFETGPSGASSFTKLNPGDTGLTGWTIGGNSVDYIRGYWNAADGRASVDLSGDGAGSISQQFATDVGATYRITFSLAGNPFDQPATKSLNVSTGGAPTLYSFDTAGRSFADMGWSTQTYDFTATDAFTTLSFASLVGTPYGPAIDDVSIVTLAAVPEPAGWTMMIAGVALAGGAMRRRGRLAAA